MPKTLQDADKEIVARIFRDVIFDKPIGEEGWKTSKVHYLKDIQKFLDELNKKGYDLVSINNKKK